MTENVERRSGLDRRESPPGRVVYSDGWIIRSLQVLAVITAIIAAVALITSITDQASQIQQLQQSRANSRLDSCELLRGIVLLATPNSKQAEAQSFLERTPLRNCRKYSQQ